MRVNDIFAIENGEHIRILLCSEEQCYAVSCHHFRMPFILSAHELEGMKSVSAEEYTIFTVDEDISTAQRCERDNRFALIKPLLNNACIYDKPHRNKVVKQIVGEHSVSRRTVLQYLWKYWVYQSKNILLPTGRTSAKARELTTDEKTIRWALNKYYYTPQKQSLQTAYKMMLRAKFCDAQGQLKSNYPTFWQFRYYFRQHRDPISETISRQGLKAYQRNHRPFTGSVCDYAHTIGVYMTDISGDISANVQAENKIIFDPTSKDCIPYNVFASIDAIGDETERLERLEQLAYLLLPDKANDSEAGVFFCKNGRKMITAALICYYGMGWDFIRICEHFLSNDWRSLLNDIASQQNQTANMYISSFAGASEQNTAGCKQAADDALKLFATNEKIKNALRKTASYEQSISPATLETNSIYIYIPDEKLKIYGDLLRIITAQSMEYFSARPKGNKQMILFCLDEFASFGKLQITESLRKLRKRHIRIMVLTQSLADLDMIYGKDERKAMLGNFKFTILLGCKDTETQEYFSKMIGDKPSFGDDENKNNRPIIRPAELAHLEQDLYVICDDGAVRLRKNFYFKS